MALTPMMIQYFEVKEKSKDAILFFRLGDFYEMFFEDAEVASRELELTLTGRDCGLENRAPMCGVPFHAAENYISTLVSKGFKVAICEQVEDPAVAKGIVKRDIIKIVTPGTYTNSSYLEESKNNFIVSLFLDGENVCLSSCDLSTGEFYCTETSLNGSGIIDEICKFEPSEVVVPEGFSHNLLDELKERMNFSTSYFNKKYFNENISSLEAQFSNLNDIKLTPTEICGCNGIINYIRDTQKDSLCHINKIEVYDVCNFMMMDINSRRNLEIMENLRDKSKRGTLLSVIDKTNTAMGGRRIRKWLEEPLLNVESILDRQGAIEELSSSIDLLESLKDALRDIYDIERLVGKISSKAINAKELMALKTSISKIPNVRMLLEKSKSKLLLNIFKKIDTLQDIYELLEQAIIDSPGLSIKEGNIIKSGYNKEVDNLREAKSNGKLWISQLENSEKEVTGIRSLKIGYNKVFGYFIEITKANLSSVPEGRYIRKQTLSNAERYITPELKEMEEKVLGAEEKLITLEYEIFVEIRNSLEKNIDRMKSTAKLISEIDCLWSLSVVGKENNYVKPEINVKGEISIIEGRHPVVEQLTKNNSFVANDTTLDNIDNRLMLITGPNMAGKSTYMRQVALISILTQIGSFVPAKKANISICDKIFTRIGASDDLAGGKSTFMVEMWEVSNILKNATGNSLVLLDEVGRGTSTYDGLSIAWSVIEYICNTSNIKCKTLFATHYHELTKLEGEIAGVKNYSIAAKKVDNSIIFLRKIIRGGADESYGIEVAKLAGLPEQVIVRAREILLKLEDNKEDEEVSIKNKENTLKDKEDLKKAHANEVAVDSNPSFQISFEDIAIKNLVKEISNIDILKLNPMEGFNKLYEIINKAKEL